MRSFETRTTEDIDYARIVHSAAFRRLQGKTQTMGVAESDFLRTRLTHSMEVASIGVRLVHSLRQRLLQSESAIGLPLVEYGQALELLPSDQFVQTVCLAHDIGHPPFGHGGEAALNYEMRDFGGFEGNGQTLRILANLEPYSANHGMNLTRRSLLGVLKYPVSYSKLVASNQFEKYEHNSRHSNAKLKPPKCYLDCENELVHWLLAPFSAEDQHQFQKYQAPSTTMCGKPLHKGFDAALMELADDISYGVYDLEDAVSLDLVRKSDWHAAFSNIFETPAWFDKERLGSMFFGETWQRKKAIGEIIHFIILAIKLERDARFSHPLLALKTKLPAPERQLLCALHGMVEKRVIALPNTQMLEFKGQKLVRALFEVYASDPQRLLPEAIQRRHAEAEDTKAAMRVVCDHVASLTDEQASRQYQKLFMPKMGSIFDAM